MSTCAVASTSGRAPGAGTSGRERDRAGARWRTLAARRLPANFGLARSARRRLAAAPRVATDPLASSASTEDEASPSYYDLLGVSPRASTAEIKAAYRALVKEYHPDVSNDEDTTEFQIFLNVVYETLIDEDKRAAYDSIAGFDLGGINPFLDRSFPADQVFVDEFTCIGCRNCNNVCPSSFGMEEEWGRARVMAQEADSEERLQEAIDTCPVSCIHWVSAPQLALLESMMAQMERVAAWIVMTGGSRGADVFQEASMAWEKRQAALRRKYEVAAWETAFTSAAAGSTMQDSARRAAEAEGAGREPGSGGLGRKTNATAVAAAARKWRDYQRSRRQRQAKFITTLSSASLDVAESTSSIADV